MHSSVYRTFPILLLLFLGGGLSLAIFGVGPTLPPFRQISTFSYATMAPFQAAMAENAEIVADGLREDDVWAPIPLEQYLPLPPGERMGWTALWSIALERSDPQDDPGRIPGYRRMAELVLLQKQRKGTPLSAVRLSLETWPVSPEGYLALRHPPFTQRTLIVEVP